jgi:hypothetical protein
MEINTQLIFVAFRQQQWLRERAIMLHYTYIACLVSLKLDLVPRQLSVSCQML